MSPTAVFALLFALMATGRVLGWRRLVDPHAAHALNQIALMVCLPCAVLVHVPKLRWDPALVGLAAVPWTLMLVSVVGLLLLRGVTGWSRSTTVALLLLVPLGNTSFLGYPLCSALLGADALKFAVVYDQLGSFLLLSVVGVTILGLGQGKGRPALGAVVRRIVTFPPFLTLVAALTVVPADLPADLHAALTLLERALLPLTAIALGLQLRFRIAREDRTAVGVALFAKLVVLPAIAFGLARALGLTGSIADVAILESAMPTMVSAAALLSMAEIEPTLAAAVVGYGTALAPLSLAAWHFFLRHVG